MGCVSHMSEGEAQPEQHGLELCVSTARAHAHMLKHVSVANHTLFFITYFQVRRKNQPLFTRCMRYLLLS
jgi:hypothetical protein